MPLPVLYGNRESGHSYKVKLALALLAIEHEYREVDLEQPPERRLAAFREASRFGEVPTWTEDGVSLAQSNAILLHLARRSGRLGGELPSDRLAEWLFWEANRIGFSVPNLRATLTYASETPEAVRRWLRARVDSDLARLDRELAAQEFLLGSTATIADVACSAYLFWPEQAGLDLAAWPNVVRWLGRIRALPGWGAPYDLLK